MKNSQIISEITRIREIMGMNYPEVSQLSEGTIPRSVLIKAAAESLPTVLLRSTGKASLDAIDDVEKAAIKSVLKNVDNTLTDAVLDAKTGSELVEDLINAGVSSAQKFGTEGASALVRVMSKVDDFAEEMSTKIANDPIIKSQLDDLAVRMVSNPKLYNRTLDELTKEFGDVVAKKIMLAAKVTPKFGSGVTKLPLSILQGLETALKSDKKISKAYSKIANNTQIMDAIYAKADDMFIKGETIKTADIFKIIDDYAPEETKALLKKSWTDTLELLYKTQTGEVRTKSLLAAGLLMAGLTGFYTGEGEYREYMVACLSRPRQQIKYANQVFERSYTQDEYQLGITNKLDTEEQKIFNVLYKEKCIPEVERKINEADWMRFFYRSTFGLGPLIVDALKSAFKDDEDEVLGTGEILPPIGDPNKKVEAPTQEEFKTFIEKSWGADINGKETYRVDGTKYFVSDGSKEFEYTWDGETFNLSQ